MIDIEKNWIEFKKEILTTARNGAENLIEHLEKETDFKTCPASTKFHLSCSGGLLEHSLNVLKYGRIVKDILKINIPDIDIRIVCLLHDLCKANYYFLGEEWDKEYKEKTGSWRKKTVWKVKDQLPLGHGEKSIIIANKHIDLTNDEMTAIRWHMAAYDAGIHFSYPSGLPFRQSMNDCLLLKLLIIADEMAELYESTSYKDENSKMET